jgi:copper chaperone CopZ
MSLLILLKKQKMVRHIIAVTCILLNLTSCSSTDEKKIIKIEKKVMYQPLEKVVPTKKITIDVSGMTCEHACGGSIRMALKETNAVDRVSFDFEIDRKTNKAFIAYDDKKISEKEIVTIIEKINDKQFTTGESEVTSITE